MPGAPGTGPVPKRSDQRRRYDDPGKIEIKGVEGTPPEDIEIEPANPLWHPAAKRWYESLGKSAQSVWFEPSDWAQAWVLAEFLDTTLQQGMKPNGQLVATWLHGAAELLTTEGARRRMRIELAKAGAQEDESELAVVSVLDDIRSRLQA